LAPSVARADRRADESADPKTKAKRAGHTQRAVPESGARGVFLPGLILLVVLLVGGAFFMSPASTAATRSSTVPFDHSRHVEWGLECVSCHVGVEDGAQAVVPRKALCRLCHTHATLGTEGEERLLLEMGREEELLWPNPRFLPRHVVFSHRRHVIVGKIECGRCHGAVGESTSLPDRPTAGWLDMDACMECHEEHGARSDCFDCHR